MKRIVKLTVMGFTLFAISSGTANAQSKCTASKLKVSGKTASARAKCFSKAVSKGDPVDTECLGKADTGLSSGFAKAEDKGDCLAPDGDRPAIVSKVNALVDTLRSQVNASGPGPSKCDSKKLGASGKKAAAKAKCHSKAAAKAEPVDTECLDKASGKFATAIGKAEEGDDCTNSSQAGTLETTVDSFITDLVSELAPPPASTTTTVPGATTTTTTNPHTCGNSSTEPPAETCDDGNTVDENTVDPIPPDACPANCRIEACPAPLGASLTVSVNFSSTASVAGYKVFVDYPEAKVTIPGSGQTAAGVITNDPTAGAVGNDLDYGLIVATGGSNAIPPSRLFTINLTRCAAPTPTAGEFACRVKQASDPDGNDVPMTCSVSIP